ncbi:YpzG family protein [Bacillus coahuilensis]
MKHSYNRSKYSSPFNKAFYNPKHAHSQANGQTQQTQDLIILENQTRKRS